MPVYVLPAAVADADADADAETIERIVHQVVTDDHKRGLTDAQGARGNQHLIEAGMSVTRVAKKLLVAKGTFKAAEALAKSSAAMQALGEGQLSITAADCADPAPRGSGASGGSRCGISGHRAPHRGRLAWVRSPHHGLTANNTGM